MRAVRLCAFSRRSAAVSDADAPEVSRFPCMEFLSVRGLFDCAELSGDSRFIAAVHGAFAVCYQLGAPELFFRSSITRPTYAPVYASMAASRPATQDSGSGWVATPFT